MEENGERSQTDSPERIISHCEECSEHTLECICSLENCLEIGGWHCQSDKRPDQSFRAMIMVMKRWKKYLDSLKMYGDHKKNINAILDSQGCNPMQNLSCLIIERIKDIGFAQARLLEILQHEIFDNLSKHNPYWQSEHEIESDKLYDLRMKLSFMSDKLLEIHHILDAKSED